MLYFKRSRYNPDYESKEFNKGKVGFLFLQFQKYNQCSINVDVIPIFSNKNDLDFAQFSFVDTK